MIFLFHLNGKLKKYTRSRLYIFKFYSTTIKINNIHFSICITLIFPLRDHHHHHYCKDLKKCKHPFHIEI
ncbi:hypothetical protein Mgra_00001331 [Meloidogyne graminicola]|uniref:Uncharacterized protein n=1 Tax=Meloidogyne graminicola TaxID=189291 RepID=A0A8T0A1B7_9BILA|nr:hypothetical protein Mgra_00001331 [Meloidogyne graminicola]